MNPSGKQETPRGANVIYSRSKYYYSQVPYRTKATHFYSTYVKCSYHRATGTSSAGARSLLRILIPYIFVSARKKQ